MLSTSESNQIPLTQVIAQRRLQTVSVQKPQQSIQQITLDASSVQPGSSQQGQLQTSPNTSQQTITQPQHSPQQASFTKIQNLERVLQFFILLFRNKMFRKENVIPTAVQFQQGRMISPEINFKIKHSFKWTKTRNRKKKFEKANKLMSRKATEKKT